MASAATSNSSDERSLADNNDTSVSSDGEANGSLAESEASFADRCEDVTNDNAGVDTSILPRPRFNDAMEVFEQFRRYFWATQLLMENVNLLSPAFYGPWFHRPGNYFSDAKQVLKDIFPFLTINCINAVWEVYRQFAASFYVLDAGLQTIYGRFGVQNHLELRALAIESNGGLDCLFWFQSPIPVFSEDDPNEFRCQTHAIKLIDKAGELKRRSDRVSGMAKLTSILPDDTFDSSLLFECEWLAFHMTTATLKRYVDNDPRGNIPEHLRPVFPISQRPNAGWLFAFCFARERDDEGVWPDHTRIQCLACLRIGRYTTVSRPNGQTDRIMRHLEKFHPTVNTAVNVFTAMAGQCANAEE